MNQDREAARSAAAAALFAKAAATSSGIATQSTVLGHGLTSNHDTSMTLADSLMPELCPRAALEVIALIAEDLACLHERGQIHGEVAPEKIRIDSELRATLVPPAIARDTCSDTDVRALGMVTALLLLGSKNRSGEEVVAALATPRFQDLAVVDGTIAALMIDMLANDGPDAFAVADAIDEYLAGHDGAARHRLFITAGATTRELALTEAGLIAGNRDGVGLQIATAPGQIAFEIIDTGFGMAVVPRDREIVVHERKRFTPLALLHLHSFTAAGTRFLYRRDD